MKANLKLLTTKSKETSEGFPIVVELFVQKNNRPRKTIGYSSIAFWDAENQTILTAHPKYKYLYPKLLEYKSKCFKINYGSFSRAEAIELLKGSKEKAIKIKEALLLDFFHVRILEKQQDKEAFQAYVDVKNAIKKYINPDKDIAINKITYEWLLEFRQYLLRTGCEMGGAMSYFRTLRAVYKEAQRRTSLNIKTGNPFIGIIKTSTPKDVIELDRNEFKKINTFIPKKGTTASSLKKMQRTISLNKFQYYIGGHDLVDVALLKWTDIKNNRAKFKRYKNRNKEGGGPLIENFVFPEAQNIIDTYGDLNNERIFSFIPDPITTPKQYEYFRRNMNRSLKSISESAKIPQLSTKSVRYLFRTYASELEIYDLTLYKIMGHKPKGITFNYQGKLSFKKIDDALLEMIKYIEN